MSKQSQSSVVHVLKGQLLKMPAAELLELVRGMYLKAEACFLLWL